MNGEEAEDDPEAEFDDEDYREDGCEDDMRSDKKGDEQLSVTLSGHGIPFAKSVSASSGSDTDDR